MAIDLSALSLYTDQSSDTLIAKATLASKTAKLFTLQTGVKGPTDVHLIDGTVAFQTRGCGFTSQGSIVLSKRTITPANVDIKESICVSDLEKYYTRIKLSAGAFNQSETLPWEQQFTDFKISKIGEALETALWKGDTGSGNGNLNKGDGLIKILDTVGTSSAMTSANTSTYMTTVATAITKSNVSSIIDATVLSMVPEIAEKTDLAIFAGLDTFKLYVAAIKDANLFHYQATQDGSFELPIPSTMVTLYGVAGLNGTNRLYAGSKSNFIYGVDLENDQEEFKMFYFEAGDEWRFISKFNFGVQVAYPQEVSLFRL